MTIATLRRKIDRRRAALVETAIPGSSLVDAREAAQVSGAEVARRLDVTRQYVNKIEASPSVAPEIAERYAEAIKAARA